MKKRKLKKINKKKKNNSAGEGNKNENKNKEKETGESKKIAACLGAACRALKRTERMFAPLRFAALKLHAVHSRWTHI